MFKETRPLLRQHTWTWIARDRHRTTVNSSLSLSLSLWRNSPTRARATSFLRFLDFTHSDTSQSVGLLSMRDRPVAQTTTHDKHPCPWRDANPQSHKLAAADPRPTPPGHWDRPAVLAGKCFSSIRLDAARRGIGQETQRSDDFLNTGFRKFPQLLLRAYVRVRLTF